MKHTTIKNAFLSLMAVATLSLWMGSMTPAQAQWGWGNNRNHDRYEDRNRRNDRRDNDRRDNGRYDNDRYDNDRYNNGRYGNNGRNGSYGRNGGYYNQEQEKGYRDGLRRGQEDMETNRIPDPNNSSHYRKGNSDYREGFRRGYQDGYPRRGSNRRW